jgi:hypothetical protein
MLGVGVSQGLHCNCATTFIAQETDTGFMPPATELIAGSGTGIGSHVGQFSLTYDLTVNLANVPSLGMTLVQTRLYGLTFVVHVKTRL